MILVFHDPKLGVLRVTREESRGRWCLWEGRFRIPGASEDTLVSLSGNRDGPDSGLVAAVHTVLAALPEVASKVDEALRADGRACTFSRFWVQSIGDWDQHDEVLQLELVTRDANDLAQDLTVYWPGDDWGLDHHVVLRKRPVGP